MAEVLNLKDGSIETILSMDDFADLIEQKLGYDAKCYLQDIIDGYDENEYTKEEYAKLEADYMELQDENKNLKEEIEGLKNSDLVTNLKKDINQRLWFVYDSVRELSNVSKSKKVIEVQSQIKNKIDILTDIVKVEDKINKNINDRNNQEDYMPF